MVSNILLSSNLFEIDIMIFSVWSHAPLTLHPEARGDSLAGTVWRCDVLCSILDLFIIQTFYGFNIFVQYSNILFLTLIYNYLSKPQPHNALKHQHSHRTECYISLFSTVL